MIAMKFCINHDSTVVSWPVRNLVVIRLLRYEELQLHSSAIPSQDVLSLQWNASLGVYRVARAPSQYKDRLSMYMQGWL